MDTPTNISTLRYFANRLHELPDPNLSTSELEQVLQWKIIPDSLNDVWHYAFSVQMFLEHLNDVDLDQVDDKTKKLIDITMKKIDLSTAGPDRWSLVFAEAAGMLNVALSYYFTNDCTINFWMRTAATFIPSIVLGFGYVKIAGAQNKDHLSSARRQMDHFLLGVIYMIGMISGYLYLDPCLMFLWRVLRGHPWKSLGVVVSSPFLFVILTNLWIQMWISHVLLLTFNWISRIQDWVNLSFVQVLRATHQHIRVIADAVSSYRGLEYMAALITGRPVYRASEEFTHPPGFDYKHKIRLLRIKRKVPFMTTLTEILEVNDDLLHTHHYDAISHVWGHEQKSKWIVVNGCRFPVTPRVHDILYQCSSYYGPRLVWIDNICINQVADAVDEKTAQIPKMRSIYDHARTVQVFLVDSPTAWLAYHFMHHLLMLFGSSKDLIEGSMRALLLRAECEKWVRARIDALLELFGNQWFERAWVIQEFVVARDVQVHYSGFIFDWTKLVLLAEMLEDGGIPEVAHCLMSGGNKPGVELKTMIKRPLLLSHWRKRVLFERYFQLSRALSSFQGSKAVRWQDKIFAFVGFTNLTDELSEILDYSLPKDRVLLTVANYVCRREGALLQTFPFAGLSALPTYPANLPTWVADWTITRRITPIAPADQSRYKATEDKHEDVRGGGSDREIVIRGLVFDCISAVSSIDLSLIPDVGNIRSNPVMVIQKTLDYFNNATNLARGLVADPYNPIESINQSLDEAICRTMFGDATTTSYPAEAEYADLMTRFIDHGTFMTETLRGGKFKIEDLHPLPWSMAAYNSQPWREPEIRKLMQQTENVRWLCGDGRRFCVTEKRFIGLIPRVALPGDLVCLLFGSPVPMILRKCPSVEKYQLVGEAYVHGIMSGEGLKCGIYQRLFTIV